VSPLHEALQSWKGPDRIASALRDAGYGAHLVYQRAILEFCQPECSRTDVDIYWHETAREFVSSAGSDFDLGLHRKEKGYYKSPYLEALRVNPLVTDSPFRVLPSLHPCVHVYYSELEFGGSGLYGRIRAQVEERKRAEFAALEIDASRWTDSRRDFQILLDEAAERHGFELSTPQKIYGRSSAILYRKEAQNGLLFYFNADSGRREPYRTQLPIQFWVGHKTAREDDFFVADFRNVVAGFEQYGYFATPEAAVLGIEALVFAFDAFSRSF